MLQIIKNRQDIEQVCSFLSSFKTDRKICVPMLYDGLFENALSQNNSLICVPGDDNFKILWEVIRDKPQMLSRFIEVCKEKKETGKDLSQVLKIQKNELPRAYTLLNLCIRSNPKFLMNTDLADKEEIFTGKYLNFLKKYTLPFTLSKYVQDDCLTFQDLTYLTVEEVDTFKDLSDCLLITNNKQHIYLFDGANCSMIDEHFLIWR